MAGEDVRPKYKHSPPITVLFNPWSDVDQVHFTEDKQLLDEYILNDSGTHYCGVASAIRSKPWEYGQFKSGILRISLDLLMKAFGRKTPVMADPIMVSRALSKIVNSNDDRGVVKGNWSGTYMWGTRPTSWTSSVSILKKYGKNGNPVRFGQCWVFAHVLTTVCRALGLPCRSLTNYASAHDTDMTCTIDNYFTEDLEELKRLKSDSVWSFHVWNEVWILRPDYPDVDNSGWHVIDATPQEKSLGVFQCGPCPVKAVKRGDINVGFDTPFVYAEVNSVDVDWILDKDGMIQNYSSVKEGHVGKKMSTKPPDGKPHMEDITKETQDCPELRCDITSDYKYPPGSKEDQEAKQRATGYTSRGTMLYQHSADMVVWLDEDVHPMVGQDVVITAHVKNVSSEDRHVHTTMTVCTKLYTNLPQDAKGLAKKQFPDMLLKAGCEQTFTVTVPAAAYLSISPEDLRLFGYVLAICLTDQMPYSAKADFIVDHPHLHVSTLKPCRSEERVADDVLHLVPSPTAASPWRGTCTCTHRTPMASSPSPSMWMTLAPGQRK